MALAFDRVAIDAELCRRDFMRFVREAWHVIEPGQPFTDGWHIEAIALHLDALARGEIKRLLVNMPPRHAKSSLISVLWPVWMWLQDPSLRFLCASYDMPLAVRDNRKCRLLLRSDWFQARWGHLFQLRRDQNQKENFENTQGGYRIATSVGGGTGKGGDILIIDDPHPIEQKKGAIRRETVLDWFKDTWSTRLNDQQEGKMIVVGQRVHDEDLSGYILSGQAGEEWVHLNLPAEFEPGSACRTYTPSGKEIWADPRIEEGELLWKERFPQSVIDKEKRVHGPLGFAALYQQRPVPAGGIIYDKNNARYFTIDWQTETYLLETPRGIKTVPIADCWKFCTVDLAISEKESADWFVAAAYAVTPWRDLLLLDILRDHFTLPEQQEHAVIYHLKHLFQLWAIEAVAYQAGFAQFALTKGIPAQPFKVHGDKVVRSGPASIWHRNGKFYSLKQATWLFEHEKEIYTFPKAPKDDQADTMSMAGIVVTTTIAPGVWDPDSDTNTVEDDRAIEEILDAEQIAEEKRLQELEEQAARSIDPFSWIEAHGGWEE